MAYYLAPIANGLGDLIVSLPALQALIETGEPTFLIMRSPRQELANLVRSVQPPLSPALLTKSVPPALPPTPLAQSVPPALPPIPVTRSVPSALPSAGISSPTPIIEGLAGGIRECDFDPSSLTDADTYFNLRAHPLQADYIWGSEEFEIKYPDYKINDVLKGICKDYGIHADFDNLTPLRFQRQNRFEKSIVLIPGSGGIVKCWPALQWCELASLLRADGHNVVVIGKPEQSEIVQELLNTDLEHVPTPEFGDALDVISSCACVIAVDTGLMHLAVNQGIPTIALFRYNTMFQRNYSHVRSLAARMCDKECVEREYSEVPNKMLEYAWDVGSYQYWGTWKCAVENEQERCMITITPELVRDTVLELMGELVL